MPRFFHKLDLRLDHISADEIKGDLINDYGTLKNFRFQDPDAIHALLKDKIHFGIPPLEFHLVEITGGVAVHTDGVRTGLTYYLKSDGSITRFWRPDQEKSQDVAYLDPDGVIRYNKTRTWRREDLEFSCEFRAQEGDCYLLNVEHPHSVEDPKINQSRYLLKWHWDRDFESVLDSIRLL